MTQIAADWKTLMTADRNTPMAADEQVVYRRLSAYWISGHLRDDQWSSAPAP